MNKPFGAKAPWRLRKLIEALPKTVPFVGPEAQERQRGKPFRARIGANECLFGPSPKAVEAMALAGHDIWKYGDPEGYELRHALAAFHGVKPENIVLGAGIDGLLGCTARMFLDEGSAVVTSNGAYPTFNFHVAAQGGNLHKVPYRDDREDIAGLIAKAGETGAVLLYLSNPDNPMGTWWSAADIRRMIDSLPDGCLLLLDEAYCDYAPEGIVPPIDTSIGNVLRLRTFSKAYGMAGARVGYCIGEETLISEFEKVRDHYGMNRTAEIGAMAALADQDWLAQTVRKTAEARARIADIGRANGLAPIPLRQPISLRSIAGGTRPTPRRCWKKSWRAACSSACRASSRCRVASASVRAWPKISTCSRKCFRRQSRPSGSWKKKSRAGALHLFAELACSLEASGHEYGQAHDCGCDHRDRNDDDANQRVFLDAPQILHPVFREYHFHHLLILPPATVDRNAMRRFKVHFVTDGYTDRLP